MRLFPAWLSVGVGLFLTTLSMCRADDNVTVFTSATPEYLKKRADKGPNKVETYIFMPGRFLEGNVRDRNLERTKFSDVAKALVAGLNKSSYMPAKSVGQADLLIVVHWGVTTGNAQNRLVDVRDPQEIYDLRQTYATARAEEINTALRQTTPAAPGSPVDPTLSLSTGLSRQYQEELQSKELEVDNRNTARGSSAAELLGFSRELNSDERRPMPSELARTLTLMLESERYFVVLMAYDWQRWLTERKMVRVWVSRLSISSPGVNFQTAVRRMNLAGADSFGTSCKELFMVETRKKKQTETIVTGDLIFVGFENEHKNDKAK